MTGRILLGDKDRKFTVDVIKYIIFFFAKDYPCVSQHFNSQAYFVNVTSSSWFYEFPFSCT